MRKWWLSVCLLCLVWPLAAQTNSKIRELQSRRGALQKEIAASEKMLLSTRKDVRSQLNDLNVLTGQIEQRKELIATIERDVKTLDVLFRVFVVKRDIRTKFNRHFQAVFNLGYRVFVLIGELRKAIQEFFKRQVAHFVFLLR